MIGNYLKIAFRSLMRNRLVSFINIFGLGLSMSVGMMELIIVQHETGYDHFHPFPARTYRILSNYDKKNGEHWTLASTPLPLLDAVKADTADIEAAVSVYPQLKATVHAGASQLEINGAFTEPSFFRVFGFTLASGNKVTALRDPNGIVLTKATAKRLFGASDPMGKVIDMGKKGNFVVTGILADNPLSHIDFDAYASLSAVPNLVQSKQLPDRSGDWGDCRVAYTYVLLKSTATRNDLLGEMKSIAAGVNRKDKYGVLAFTTQPIEKIRPADGHIYNDIGPGTTWTKLWTGIDVALLLLLAACFNYTNLTVARALTRAKEIGIRKIAGARRIQVFTQYVVEACVLAFLALGFAWILLSYIVKYAPFNDGYEMIPSAFRYNFRYVAYTLAFALFAGLVAGVAPAWLLSAFKPLRVLRNLSTAKIFGNVGLQKTLIVFQYSLSLVMIIFLFAFYRQFDFLSSADRGFKRDNVLVIPLDGVDKKRAFPTVAGVGGVRSVSGLSVDFQRHSNWMRGLAWLDNAQKGALSMNYFFTNPTFISSMNIPLLAGRNFAAAGDSAAEQSVVINNKAAQLLGFKEVHAALGKKLWVDDSTALEIIGVVKDFNYDNAGRPVDPMAFRNKEAECNYLFVDVGYSDHQSVSARIAHVWRSLAPSQPFSFSWLDDDLEKSDSQRATISLLGYLAFMAISIATLGLLGLVVYSVEVKRKEIAIRKVIGASRQQMVRLLSRGFIKLIFIAGAIGIPIGYCLSFLFQMNFVQRPGYGFLSAMTCFALLLGIGLFTIISQTYKASGENPTKNLKVE
ncbi:ABC transporter permease [Puia dinghuensis]|uniref:ABC transporter permease n=1 Tax=Puia dinghuensis TaxID=1792502 RepID=A0A8J2XTC7_9BACT|nr:ABC transporter permease [Puia dinghuensis]GGA98147.1 ABC transporter permease [Puia dinghuensis]